MPVSIVFNLACYWILVATITIFIFISEVNSLSNSLWFFTWFLNDDCTSYISVNGIVYAIFTWFVWYRNICILSVANCYASSFSFCSYCDVLTILWCAICFSNFGSINLSSLCTIDICIIACDLVNTVFWEFSSLTISQFPFIPDNFPSICTISINLVVSITYIVNLLCY